MLTCPTVDARFDEIGWIPDYLDDLDADFRAFYGEPDMLSLSGPRFFALAERVFAYGGVMTARAEAMQAADRARAGPALAAPTGATSAPRAGGTVSDATTLARDSRFAGIFSIAKVPVVEASRARVDGDGLRSECP